MTRLILLTVAALVASPAPAQIYGTSDGGCERAAGNPINDLDAYFDGKTLAGQDCGAMLLLLGRTPTTALATVTLVATATTSRSP